MTLQIAGKSMKTLFPIKPSLRAAQLKHRAILYLSLASFSILQVYYKRQAQEPLDLLSLQRWGELFFLLSIQIPDKHCDTQVLATNTTVIHIQAQLYRGRSAKHLARLSASKQKISDQKATSREIHKQKPTDSHSVSKTHPLCSAILRSQEIDVTQKSLKDKALNLFSIER